VFYKRRSSSGLLTGDGTVLVDVLGQESIPPVVVTNATIALELPAQSAVVLVPAP
jgi:hypothetical protein